MKGMKSSKKFMAGILTAAIMVSTIIEPVGVLAAESVVAGTEVESVADGTTAEEIVTAEETYSEEDVLVKEDAEISERIDEVVAYTSESSIEETTEESTEELNLEEIAISGKCGDNAYFEYYWDGVSGVYTGTLVISGTGAIYDYPLDTCPWRNSTINKLVIGEGITYIGKYNFAEMEHMTSVKIPDSVKKIADWAFYGTYIDNLDLGNGVEEVGESAFEACHIKSLKMPTSLRKIGKGAFESNELKNIEIPKGVVEIGEDAFRTANEYFRNVTIPNTVEVIGSYAFYSYTGCNVTFEEGCKLKRLESGILYGTKNVVLPDSIEELAQDAINHVDVTSVTLNEGLKRIEDGALRNGITSIHIPASVEYIGNAFENDYLEKITFADNSNLQEIGSYTFQSCRFLKEITIPASVKKIGTCAFNLAGLEKVNFEAGSNLEYIDASAFNACNLSEITIPDSVKGIGRFAVSSQKELTVNFGENSNLEYIDGKAFQPCSSMAGVTVNLSDKLTNSKWIDNNGVEVDINKVRSAESDCIFMRDTNFVKGEDLGNIYAQGKCGEDAYWKVIDFKYEENRYTYIFYKLVLYGTGPMYDGAVIDFVDSLKEKTYIIEFEEGSSISYIGKHAFDCMNHSLKELVIPGSVKKIGSGAFSSFEIGTVRIEEGVKEIESGAFAFIKTLHIPSSVEIISDYPFKIRERIYFNPECKITHLPRFVTGDDYGFTIPDNVIEIRRNDLIEYGANSLNSAGAIFRFTENSKCERIEDFAFSPMNSFLTVYGPLPKNLEYIGTYALGRYMGADGSPRIAAVPDKVKYIGGDAFSNYYCGSLDEIILPEGLEHLGAQMYTVRKINVPDSLNYWGGAFNIQDITGSLNGWVDFETGKPVDLKTYTGIAYRSVGDKKVIGEIVKATSITLDKTNIALNKGETHQIVATVKPDNASNKDKLVYSTGDASVATVSASGLVTAIGGGNTTITVTVADGSNKQAKLSVYVKPEVESASIVPEKPVLRVGEVTRVNITAQPTGYLPLDEIEFSAHDVGTTEGEPARSVAITERFEDGYVLVKAVGTNDKTVQDVELAAKVAGISANGLIKILPSKISLDYAGGMAKEGEGIVADIDVVTGSKIGINTDLDSIIPVKAGYLFDGWYTQADSKGKKITSDTLMSASLFTTGDGRNYLDDWKVYAGWTPYEKGKMTVKSIGDYTYTGSQIKPVVKVYDGDLQLVLGKDYSVSYKNNTAARIYDVATKDARKDPTVVITGKGNYNGKVEANFSILPKDITDSDVDMNEKLLVKAKTTKEQKLIPTVKWGKIVLKNNKDFTLEYPDSRGEAYKAAGQYRIVVKAKEGSNYTGERTVIMNIVEPEQLINKASVKNCKSSYVYNNGSEIRPDELESKFEVILNKKTLTKNVDYRVSYENNIEVGTARLHIIGIGSYSGTKTVTFKVTGKNISAAKYQYEGESKENKMPAYEYTGDELRPDDKIELYNLVAGIKNPISKSDYDVTYLKNINPGSATMVITGKGIYAGTTKKITFKIGAAPITEDMVSVSENAILSKGGAKPVVEVRFKDVLLKEGTDYTLRVVNNKSVANATDAKAPAVTVTGKGLYKGTVKDRKFNIIAKELSSVTATAMDKDFKPGIKGYDKTKLVVTDIDGKNLVDKKDYVVGKYTYANATDVKHKGSDEIIHKAAGAEVEAEDILVSAGDQGVLINIPITAYGINYLGTTSASFRVTNSNIAKASVAKISMTYTGDEIKLTTDDNGSEAPVAQLASAITYKKADKSVVTLIYGTDYEIVEGSYVKNVAKGTAKVTIKGKGTYGGTKVITFSIVTKSMN